MELHFAKEPIRRRQEFLHVLKEKAVHKDRAYSLPLSMESLKRRRHVTIEEEVLRHLLKEVVILLDTLQRWNQ